METVHNHFAATRKSYRVVKYAEEDMYPNIRVLLGIGCSLPVSFAEAELLSLILWLATNQVNLRNRMSDEWLHQIFSVSSYVRTCTYALI